MRDGRAPHPQVGALLLRPSSALILFEAGTLGAAGVAEAGAVHGAAPLTSDERKDYGCSGSRLHPRSPRDCTEVQNPVCSPARRGSLVADSRRRV
jgi:hypothetical protein